MTPNSVSPPASSLFDIWHIVSALAVVGIELALLAALTAALYTLATWLGRRVTMLRSEASGSRRALPTRMRLVVVPVALAMAVAIVGYNGWLAFRGIDVKDHTVALLGAISSDIWIAFGIALVKVAAVAIGLVAAVRILRIMLNRLEASLNH